MKTNQLLILSAALLFSTVSFGQNTQAIKTTPVVINSSATMPAGRIKVADTTTIKIQKLQEDNNKLTQDVAELKQTVATLVTKSNQDHFELGLAKLSLKTITENMVPVAYAAFNPELDKVTNGYSFKIAKKFGVTGNPTQVYSSVTITLDHSFDETPVIVTAIGEDHINSSSGNPVGVVTYQFLPPNKIRFTIKEAKTTTVIAPFSVVVFGR